MDRSRATDPFAKASRTLTSIITTTRLTPAVALLAIAVLSAGASPASELEARADSLNLRILEARQEGRQWPKYPGGLRAFLFPGEATVLPKYGEPGFSDIVFRDTTLTAGGPDGWYDARLKRESVGVWKVWLVEPCEESRAQEARAKLIQLRELRTTFGFDPARISPLEFLESLKKSLRPSVTVMLPEFGWVRERDLPGLVALLDSPEPCANVSSGLSSYIDQSLSTIGNEAAYLIEGFRADEYPPRLNSTRPRCDIQEIKSWWEGRGNR